MTAGIAVGAFGSLVAAGVLVGIRGEILNANVALVLVLFVLAGAVIGGRMAGVVSALFAATAFDFFHTKPYNTLKISHPSDLETTVLLLLVGLLIGEVSSWSMRLRARLRSSGDEIRRMHRVAELAVGGDTADDLTLTVTAELMDTLQLRDCYFERPPYLAEFAVLERTGQLHATPFYFTREGFELPRDGVALPVVGPAGEVGRFVMMPTPGVGASKERRLIAVALADQLGMVLSARRAS
jgi:hypothetical protein